MKVIGHAYAVQGSGVIHGLGPDHYRLCKPIRSSRGLGPGNLRDTDSPITFKNCLRVIAKITSVTVTVEPGRTASGQAISVITTCAFTTSLSESATSPVGGGDHGTDEH